MSWLGTMLKRLFSKKQIGTGSIPQPVDKRDYQLSKVLSGTNEFQSNILIDLRDRLQPLRDQYDSNACTGFAQALLLEYVLSLHNNGWKTNRVSPLFLWNNAKKLQGNLDSNGGVYMRNSFKALFKQGFVMESFAPFNRNNYLVHNSDRAEDIASLSKLIIDKYAYYVLHPTEIPSVLAKGFPVSIGVFLNKEWYSDKGFVEGVENVSNAGHNVLVVGQTPKYYIVANSWGKNRGENGYYYVNKEYVHKYAYDCMALYYKQG